MANEHATDDDLDALLQAWGVATAGLVSAALTGITEDARRQGVAADLAEGRATVALTATLTPLVVRVLVQAPDGSCQELAEIRPPEPSAPPAAKFDA